MNDSFARLLTNVMLIAGITSSDIDKVIDDGSQEHTEDNTMEQGETEENLSQYTDINKVYFPEYY